MNNAFLSVHKFLIFAVSKSNFLSHFRGNMFGRSDSRPFFLLYTFFLSIIVVRTNQPQV